jgi:multiple sugar transport system permease protein
MFTNSFLIAIITTFGQLLISSMAAYAFARIKFRGSDLLFLLYLATMMIPSQVTVTPLFILMRYLGWLDTYQGLIVPGLFKAFGVFLMRQSFLSLPRELEEAAYIDGANRLVIFIRVILPLSKPVLITQGLMAFMDSWNSYLWPLFVTSKAEMFTLPLGLANLQGQYLTEWNVVMAGIVLSIIPMLCIYIVAQKYLIKGFVTSGLKG